MSLLEIKDLCKEFEGVTPLKSINLTVEQGEVISIIGPSGTGKSTLLRCINRLETPTSGSVIIDGEDVCTKGTDLTAVRKKVGMVFQSFNLFGHKNIIENIIMPQMDLSGKDRNQAKKEALLQLRKVGLEEKAYNMPDAPSRLSKITPLPPLAYEVWLSVSVFENNPMFAESMPDFSKAVFISS